MQPFSRAIPRTLYILFIRLHRARAGVPQKSNKIWIFAVLGRGGTDKAREILPPGVKTLSTPGKPNSGNFIFRHFLKVRCLNFRSTFHLDVPMDLPWQLRPNRFPVLVDGSTRLQFGQSGFLPSIPWTPETRTSISSVPDT